MDQLWNPKKKKPQLKPRNLNLKLKRMAQKEKQLRKLLQKPMQSPKYKKQNLMLKPKLKNCLKVWKQN